MASTKRPLRSTTGRRGTPPTSSRASAAGLPRRQPRMLRSTWKVPANEGAVHDARQISVPGANSNDPPLRRRDGRARLRAMCLFLPDYGQTATVSDTESLVVAQATTPRAAAEDPSIRPFKVQVPQAALDDLRRRIAATRWPDKETVTDRVAGRAAGEAAGAGSLLGQRLRLAQGGSEAQRPAAIRRRTSTGSTFTSSTSVLVIRMRCR